MFSLGFVFANVEFSKINVEAGNAINGFEFIYSKKDKFSSSDTDALFLLL